MAQKSPENFIPSTATGVQQHPSKDAPPSHPLDPLTPQEISAVTLAVRKYVTSKTSINAVRFITCDLIPPPKRDVLAFLGIPTTPGEKAEPSGAKLARRADVDFMNVLTGDAHNVTLALGDGEWRVEKIEKLSEGTQPQITPAELLAAEDVIRADERVSKLAADVGVKPEEIYADGWAIGWDERFPKSQRIQQALIFARFSQHDNLYAHPLDFIPVVDTLSGKVIHIDFPPHYTKKGELSADATVAPPLSEDALAASGRERIPPPRRAFDFLPDLMKEQDPNFKQRDDIKPLHIIQPEGVSFKMDGHVLEWQKWSMHIAFTHREGVAISTITYNDNGEIRPIFYRLSLAEMVVPYGAPEFPHVRKFAFDSGEYGMGTMANELSLGCDCLGQIHYLPGSYVAHDGSPIIIKNVVCIHEEDAGVLWKHTDYRVGGRGQAVRSRRLVVSMVCTLANYEYIWNYKFYQDGTIELEIRLTGILQVYVSGQGEPTPFGTQVAPNINAHYHQHIFSVRVDPMVDGLQNSVVETDVLPLEGGTGSAENFAGNGFAPKETVLKVASEGARSYDWELDRRWRIVNPARKHYASGKDVGYSVALKGGACRLLAKPDGWVGTRAAFAQKALWVVPDKEDEKGGRMWPAGKYVPQTREEPQDSLGVWAREDAKIENEDLIVYATVGTTHIPRPEDWPVMPVEHLRIAFKPQHFFDFNPSMDVPGTQDTHSKPAFSNGIQTNGTHCC